MTELSGVAAGATELVSTAASGAVLEQNLKRVPKCEGKRGARTTLLNKPRA